MNISSATTDNLVGVELKLPQKSDTKLYEKIFALFQKLNINNIFVKLYPENFKTFNDFIQPDHPQWRLTYAHTPLLNNIILKDLHKTKQIFQPQLFCRKNYFKQHKSWGYPIFYFTGNEPEIYEYPDETAQIKESFDYPEDIVAIVLLKKESNGFQAKNIIQMLDRSRGSIDIKVKTGSKYKILIIRKLYLYYENGLNYKLNIHDEYLLKKQSELAAFHIGNNHFQGAYLDADDFFSFDGFVTSGPEITRNYHRISDGAFKPDMALFWNKYGNNSEISNIKYIRMINTYIDGILLPKLYYIHQTTYLKADILNPFYINNLAVLKTIYKVKDEHFIFNKKYYIKALINIKRISSYKRLHDDRVFTVFFDDLININHSFFEKKISIDAMISSGVNRIIFKYDAESDSDRFILNNVLNKEENLKLYNIWLKYINRLSFYLQKDRPVSKILLLYPSLDSERSAFEATVAALEKSCFDYDIMDFQTFLSDDKCLIEPRKIFFEERSYHSLIVAGIKKIPLKALKKINAFVKSGGIAIGLADLPVQIENQEEQQKLKELLKSIWIDESNIPATNFKKHPQGGIGYFQKEISRLLPLLHEEENILRHLPVFTTCPNIKISCRDCEDHFLAFITNSGNDYYENIVLTCMSNGPVYRVSPEDDLLYPIYSVQFNPTSTSINLALEANESILLKIEKSPAETTVEPNLSDETVTHEYMDISSDEWLVRIDDRQDFVSLGDRSTANPYEWHPVFYSKKITLDKDHLNAAKIFIQFGELRDWCLLYVNDKKVSVKLYPPWDFDITPFLEIGPNMVRLEIGHSISNYLTTRYGDKKSVIPVAAYGLFGPVRLRMEYHQPVTEKLN